MTTLTLLLERVETPVGQMLILTDEQARLRAVDWQDHEANMYRLLHRYHPGHDIDVRETNVTSPARRAMDAYLEGDLTAIDSLSTHTGGTEFQRKVWAALREIPAGQAISYLELALRVGRPTAVRAVGLANGANPISIVIPCHRVIGSNRKLTGYGGGLQRKQWLLEHEGVIQKPADTQQALLPGFSA